MIFRVHHRTIRTTLALGALCRVAFGDVSTIEYKGWKGCYRVSAGRYSLVVVPQIGGKIMEYSVDGINLLWQNPSELGRVYDPRMDRYHSFGGYKLWNAPQSRWKNRWPPDLFLELGQAKVTPVDGTGLLIDGPISPTLGIQFIRAVRLSSDGRVGLQQTMRNVGRREVKWSIWDVTRIKLPGFVIFPVAEESRFPQRVRIWDEASRRNVQWKIVSKDSRMLCIVKPEGRGAKIGADNRSGWIAYIGNRLIYLKVFPRYEMGASYPDEGCSVEVWMGKGSVEVEVLSPLFAIGAGEEVSFDETWLLERLSGDVTSEEEAIGLALRFLKNHKLTSRGRRPFRR